MPDPRAYWRANLRLLAVLLVIWFSVSYGAGILFAERLDEIRLGGFKLGFWFAQQGSIYAFVAIIFVYCAAMTRLERVHGVGDDAEATAAGADAARTDEPAGAPVEASAPAPAPRSDRHLVEGTERHWPGDEDADGDAEARP